jgi:hypothetical protein
VKQEEDFIKYENKENIQERTGGDKDNTSENYHPCPKSKCERIFKFQQTLRNHLRKSHKDFSIETEPEDNFCKICKKEFKSKGGFKNHMKHFHPHSCPRCTKEFKENIQLLSHLKNSPNCEDESKKVIIKRERNDEMKEESEDKPKKLKVCPCLHQRISTVKFKV